MFRIWSFYLVYLLRWFRFYHQALTKYDIHSPFVANFIEYVLEDDRNFYLFPEIERMRARLLRNHIPIEIMDYGAGSLADRRKIRPVSSIAKHGAVSEETGKQLFRLVAEYRPKTLLELGCSLGISGMYLAGATHEGHLYTLEGCPETAQMADLSFKRVEISNYTLHVGLFAEVLPKILAELPQVDLVYFDGDHRSGSTKSYFEACLTKAHQDSVFVFADIHWSLEMQEAWQELRKHPKVRCSIDLFHIGVLFFKEEILEPMHLSLIKASLKPWRLGFFGHKI